jgi:hypothetical protein
LLYDASTDHLLIASRHINRPSLIHARFRITAMPTHPHHRRRRSSKNFYSHRLRATKETAAFIAVILVSVALCILISHTGPAQKRAIDYLAQGIFSALFAVPAGAAWRSLRQARQKNR